jgi:hypothetical protein
MPRGSAAAVHLMRNLLAHAGRQGRGVASAFIATAFAQEDAEAAKAQWRKVADQLRPKLPKLAAFMDDAEADVLAYMDFPLAHRPKLHSTTRANGSTARSSDASTWSAWQADKPASPTGERNDHQRSYTTLGDTITENNRPTSAPETATAALRHLRRSGHDR